MFHLKFINMKKLFMVIALAAMTMSASAQKVGVWYGLGFNKITNMKVDGVSTADVGMSMKMYCSPVNFGVTYTQEMGNFDLTGGLSYRQKGSKVDVEGTEAWKPKFLQLDVLGAYNFYKNDEGSTKIGIQTGPYVALMTGTDSADKDQVRKCDVGWQVGVAAAVSNVTFSAGYEFGFIKLYKDEMFKELGAKVKGTLNQGIYVKVGYQFGL